MPALLLSPGFPVTNGGGQEGLGVGVNTATLQTVTPNGTVGTVAEINALIATELAGANRTIRLAQLWRSPNAF